MRRRVRVLFIMVLALFAIADASAQGIPACAPPPELIAHYDHEIRSLAIEYAWLTNHPDTALIKASPALYEYVAEGMAAIFNSSSAARDSVFDNYCVHDPFRAWNNRNFMVVFNANQGWTNAWMQGQTITGNPLVDSFFARHKMHVKQYMYMGFVGHCALVEAEQVLNVRALGDSLALFPGIYYLEEDGLIGGAGNISFSVDGNIRDYRFSYQWNDCPDGCDNWNTWHFQVDTNCTPTFVGSYQFGVFGVEPLPDPLNCNITINSAADNIEKNALLLFPNPASDVVQVKSVRPINNISVYSSVGRLVFCPNNGTEINIRHLPAGMYVVVATDDEGKQYYSRLMKE